MDAAMMAVDSIGVPLVSGYHMYGLDDYFIVFFFCAAAVQI